MSFSSKLLTLGSKIKSTNDDSNELYVKPSQTYDPNSGYENALKYSDIAASNSNRQLANREWQSSQQQTQNYQNKANIDTQTQQQRATNQQALQNQQGVSGGGSTSYYDGLTRYDYESTGSPYLPSSRKVARKDKDVAMAEQQQEWNRVGAATQNSYASNMADRNASNNLVSQQQQNMSTQQLQNSANQNQQKLANIDANSRIQSAAIGAQGNILGSLFGSVGSGSPNYKFWS